jgi:peptidyl-prolyl cis-trans isomerase SurA
MPAIRDIVFPICPKNGPDLMRNKSCFSVLRMAATLVLAMVLALGDIGGAVAQGLFAPVRKVNDRLITEYDVAQRIAFMELLNVGAADMRREAIDRLTEEAVQMDAARRLEMRVTRDQISDGMNEFAGRVGLTTDELLATLAEGGVDRESFENFVRAGLLWRQVVDKKFPMLVNVGANDVARARDVAAIRGTQRVLMSEIFLPTDPEFAEAVAQIMAMIEAVTSVEEFSTLAREFSLAGSRDAGGRLDWLPAENLPPQIAGQITQSRPGQIVGPIELGGAIAYFQLRALDSIRDIPAQEVKLTYARLLLAGGRSEANLATVAQIAAQARVCADLGPFARGLSEQALTERSAFLREIPQSDSVELARLDRGGISANTLDGGNLVVLMLCARELEREGLPTPDQLSNLLFDQRLSALSDVKLKELIADADIRNY